MSKEYQQAITLSNGEKREVVRWQTTSGEVEWIRDIKTDKVFSAYALRDCIRELETYLNETEEFEACLTDGEEVIANRMVTANEFEDLQRKTQIATDGNWYWTRKADQCDTNKSIRAQVYIMDMGLLRKSHIALMTREAFDNINKTQTQKAIELTKDNWYGENLAVTLR